MLHHKLLAYFTSADRTNETIVVVAALLGFFAGMHSAEVISVLGAVVAYVWHVVTFWEG